MVIMKTMDYPELNPVATHERYGLFPIILNFCLTGDTLCSEYISSMLSFPR